MNTAEQSGSCRCPICGENNSVIIAYNPEYLAKCENCGAIWTDMTDHVSDVIYCAFGMAPAE